MFCLFFGVSIQSIYLVVFYLSVLLWGYQVLRLLISIYLHTFDRADKNVFKIITCKLGCNWSNRKTTIENRKIRVNHLATLRCAATFIWVPGTHIYIYIYRNMQYSDSLFLLFSLLRAKVAHSIPEVYVYIRLQNTFITSVATCTAVTLVS